MIVLTHKIKPPVAFIAYLKANKAMAMKDWFWHQKPHRKPKTYEIARILLIMRSGYTYQQEFVDNWTPIDHTADVKTGDCDSWVMGARECAKSMGIKSRVILCLEKAVDRQGHCALLMGDWVLCCNMRKICCIETYRTMYNIEAVSGYALLSPWRSIS